MSWTDTRVVAILAFALGCSGRVGQKAETDSSSTDTSESTGDADAGDGDGDGDMCGNGVLDDGEACDDGNLDNDDGCNDACQITGSLLWSDTVPSGHAFGGRPVDVVVDGAGNLVVAAEQYADVDVNGSNVFVGAWTPGGTRAWTFTDDLEELDDAPVGLTVDGQGRAVVAANMGLNKVARVTTLALDGQPAWSQSIEGQIGRGAKARAFTTDAQGRVGVGGWLHGDASRSWLVQTFTPDGSSAWADTWEHSENNYAQALLALDDGSLAVMGQTGSESFDVVLRVHDDAGNLLWSDIFDSGLNDEVGFLAAGHGRIVSVVATGSGDANTGIFIRTLDLEGNLLSEHEPTGPGRDSAGAAQMLDSGEFVLAWTDDPFTDVDAPSDAVVSVFAPDGSVVWTDVFDNAGQSDRAHSMIVDGLGRIVVAGTSFDGNQDLLWLRCLEPDGSLAWQAEWDHTSNLFNGPLLTLHASGHVVVARSTPGLESTIGVRAYDEQGAAVWTWEYGNSGTDEARLLTTDVNGNAVIVGVVTIDGARQLYVATFAH